MLDQNKDIVVYLDFDKCLKKSGSLKIVVWTVWLFIGTLEGTIG